ncbi:hypothetical protein CYMTET_6414 [Cymbomonas tetramitiformis]|uniref:Uncharacterized protein n=1 Tax=Cymbomonas tetramitiformis TaxID=36881 RepID=A0AAE0LHX9_9CHLO|nr:hypothetical protein CYMTET_6414 [Cymbomonas tetramitiformis]
MTARDCVNTYPTDITSVRRFDEVVRSAASTSPPSLGENRGGEPTSDPPSPQRASTKGSAAQESDPSNEHIHDEYEDPWDRAEGLDEDEYYEDEDKIL